MQTPHPRPASAMDHKPECRVAHIKPTVENVVAYNRYRRTQPDVAGISTSDFACLETPILFGGGRDFQLSFLQQPDTIVAAGVDLFVVSSALLLWFNHLACGLEIPYSSVIYHGALRAQHERDGHQLSLLLTLDRDPLLNEQFPSPPTTAVPQDSLELVLRPYYSLYDRHYNAEIDTLFNFHDFGVNRGDLLVNNCNEAVATCLEICHADQLPGFDSDPDTVAADN